LQKTYGLRKYPYSTFQSAFLNVATGTGALSFLYFGDFRNIIKKKYSVSLDFRVLGPKYVLNYFGLGNESVQTGNKTISTTID